MASNQSQLTRIVISSRNGGGILVELQLETSANNFRTIDRYNTHDLTQKPKRNDEWIRNVIDCVSQPAVADLLHIAIPGVPDIEESQYQKLNRIEKAYLAILMAEQHNAEMKQPTRAMAAHA